jgi:hypothetical protein
MDSYLLSDSGPELSALFVEISSLDELVSAFAASHRTYPFHTGAPN